MMKLSFELPPALADNRATARLIEAVDKLSQMLEKRLPPPLERKDAPAEDSLLADLMRKNKELTRRQTAAASRLDTLLATLEHTNIHNDKAA